MHARLIAPEYGMEDSEIVFFRITLLSAGYLQYNFLPAPIPNLASCS